MLLARAVEDLREEARTRGIHRVAAWHAEGDGLVVWDAREQVEPAEHRALRFFERCLAEQRVEFIDYAQEKYGKRVKFLTFREALERIEKNALHDSPLRHSWKLDGTGEWHRSTARLLDIDGDGFMDVVCDVAFNRDGTLAGFDKTTWPGGLHCRPGGDSLGQ